MRFHERTASILVLAALTNLGCPDPKTSSAKDDFLSAGHRELASALREVRPFEPRLIAADRWSECPRTVCTEDLLADPEQRRALRAAGDRIQREARGSADERMLHALGIWSLLRSDGGERLDRAVSRLEAAAGAAPARGDLWNDLAAAYYLRARRQRHPEDLVRSLAACDRSLRATPGLRPALFNRALALEALFLSAESAAAWRELLAVEESPGWIREARERLGRAEARSHPVPESRNPRSGAAFAAADPFGAQQHAETALLVEPGASPAAARNLTEARTFADRLLRQTGDSLLREEVDAWEAALRGGPGDRKRERLVAGYAAFREARQLYDELATRAAGELFRRAERETEAGGSPLHLWASYYAAVCRYWDGELDPTPFRKLRKLAERRGYPMLEGYSSWMIGLIAASRSDFDQAAEDYGRAAAIFDRAGLVQEVGFVHVLRSNLSSLLSAPRSAWDDLYLALSSADSWTNQKWKQALLDELAARTTALGEPETALYFHNRAREAALAGGLAPVISETHARYALSLSRAGSAAEARAEAIEARKSLARIQDPAARRQIEAVVLVAEAHLLGPSAPSQAVERLEIAIQDRTERGLSTLIPELQLERARLLLALGRTDDAEAALLRALEAGEAGGRSLQGWHQRSAYSATLREIVDTLIDLQLGVRHDPLAAFLFAERGRVGELLAGKQADRQPDAEGLRRLQSRLGANQAILVYRVQDQRLLIWLIRQKTFDFFEQPLGSRDLIRLTVNLIHALREPAASRSVARWSSHLHRFVIAPAVPSLDGVERLWIVPDGPLFQLPFAVLLDPGTQEFLVEKYELAKTLTAGIDTDAPPSSAWPPPPFRVLAVGDPEIDRSRFPAFSPLPAARREARAIARTHGVAETGVLIGPEATRDRFLAGLPEQDIVHFAGHALPNSDLPERSMLLFAGGDGSTGAVYGEDIPHLPQGRPRLVVLAACSTGGSGSVAAGGFSGLARPFLAAGVPIVVGSLWDIEDRRGERLLTSFHYLLASGTSDPYGALRSAQVRELRDSRAGEIPSDWAAFEAYAPRPNLP